MEWADTKNGSTRARIMLEFRVEELAGMEREIIAQKIEKAGGHFHLHVRVANVYIATSPDELASNWLKIWYTAEQLANSATTAKCAYREAEGGAGDFLFDFTADDSIAMSDALLSLASAFDDDDLEATSLIHDEAHDWFRNRGTLPAWFPNLERHFLEDREQANEWRKTYPEDEGDDEVR